MKTHRGMSRLDWILLVLAAAGSVAIVVGLKLSLPRMRHGDDAEFAQAISPQVLPGWTKAKPRIAEAEAEDDRAWRAHLSKVDAFFQSRDGKARGFAEEVLSWKSKLKYGDSKLGISKKLKATWWELQTIFGDGPTFGPGELAEYYLDLDPHQIYLAECFERHFFTPEDLVTLIEGCVAAYLAQAQEIENRLLVKLEADLRESGITAPDMRNNTSSFRQHYGALIAQTLPSVVGGDLTMDFGTTIASMPVEALLQPVVARAMSTVAVELGFSTAAAGSTVVTLGAAVVVWWVSSELIDFALKEAGYDPQAEIAAKVREAMDKVRVSVGEAVGSELKKMHDARCRVRREALQQLFSEGVKP